MPVLAKIPFNDLIFLADNPRSITAPNFEALKSDISADPEFFNSRPTLVNLRDGKYYVYAGEMRARAANASGWPEIPCNIEDDLPEDVMRRRAILDNTHRGSWDASVLSGWEYEPDQLFALGVPSFVLGGSEAAKSDEIDYLNQSPTKDYAANNGEIDTDEFEDKATIVLNYTMDESIKVKAGLLKHGITPEAAVWNLLGYE